jgi:hypothetical protein
MTKLPTHEKRAAWKRWGMRNPKTDALAPAKSHDPITACRKDGLTSSATAYLVVINRFPAGIIRRK